MAGRLSSGNVQDLEQFVIQSPWSSQKVQVSSARKVEQEFVPEA